MEWKKLNKKSLESLKKDSMHVLVSDLFNSEYPYDVIYFIDFNNDFALGLSEEEMKKHWYSMLHHDTYSYDDEELLCLFQHFCLIDKPEVK